MSVFLIVEDEPLLAMMIEEMLLELGHTVFASASDVAEGLRFAAAGRFDIAILDVNVRGQLSYPVADILVRRALPIIFSTGYGRNGCPERFANVPVLTKPFLVGDLGHAISNCAKIWTADRRK